MAPAPHDKRTARLVLRTIAVLAFAILLALVSAIGEFVATGVFGIYSREPISVFTSGFGLAPYVLVALAAVRSRPPHSVPLLIAGPAVLVVVMVAIQLSGQRPGEFVALAASSAVLVAFLAIAVTSLLVLALSATSRAAVLVGWLGFAVGGIIAAIAYSSNWLALTMWVVFAIVVGGHWAIDFVTGIRAGRWRRRILLTIPIGLPVGFALSATALVMA